MDYNESQQNVPPEPGEQKSQDAERLSVTAEPVKNILVALGLVPPLPISTERSEEDIQEALCAPERATRVAAARALGEQESTLFLPLVLVALRHEDEFVRAASVGSIGRLKEKVSLDLLLEALRDTAWYVRTCAVHELGCQIERAPILPLIEALRDEDESVRAEAVWALSRFQEHAPEVLLESLHDPSWLVREAVDTFMKERLEQILQASGRGEAEDFFQAHVAAEMVSFPEGLDVEGKGAHANDLPKTGPLSQRSIEGENVVYERRRRVERPINVDEPRPMQQRVKRESPIPVKATKRWRSWVGKALVALLILGLGLSWSTLAQRFHQSSVTGQGSLLCVFHPGVNPAGNVMAWPSGGGGVSLLAVAGVNSTIESYDVNSCRHLAEYKQELGSSILALKSESDGLYVIILTASGAIEGLLERDGEQSHLLFMLAAGVNARQPLVVWSENRQYVAVNRGDSRVQIWSVQDGRLKATYSSPYGAISTLAWSPDSTEIAAASVFDSQSKASSIQIWSLITGNAMGADIHMSATVESMGWSKDGENLLIYDQNAVVNKWSRQTQNYNSLNPSVYTSLQELPNFPLVLAYAPDSRQYAISTAGNIQIWDAISAQQLGSVSDSLSEIDQLSWSDDGVHIAASSRDGTVQMWKIAG